MTDQYMIDNWIDDRWTQRSKDRQRVLIMLHNIYQISVFHTNDEQ